MTCKDYHKLKEGINNIRFFAFGNILLGDALTIDIPCFFKKGKGTLREKLKFFLSFISMSISSKYEYSFNKSGESKDEELLFYFSHIYESRKDYLDSFDKIKSIFSSRTELTGKTTGRKVKFRNLKLLALAPVWMFQLSKLDCSLQIKICILHGLFPLKAWYDFVCQDVDPKNYSTLIVFFDARSYDNIIVQYFKSNNIRTATLQHGHFNAASRIVDNTNIAFEGFISDIFLMWGEYSKNEAIKSGIDPKRIKTVGCPKYIGLDQKLTRNQTYLFGLVLDGEGRENLKTNIEMIRIANEFAKEKNMKCVIKPHPVSDISVFEDYIDEKYLFRITAKDESVVEYAETVDFSIVMGSSVYSELLYLGAVAFRFISRNAPDRYDGIDWGVVRNLDNLVSLYELYNTEPENVYEKIRKTANYLFEPGDAALNYQNAIEELAGIDGEKENINGI